MLAFPLDSLAQTVTVSSWGGLYGESQRKAYFEPFTAATGIQVLEDDWGGDLDKIRAMVATGRYHTHVLDAESSDVVQGCAEGILEPIHYVRIGISPEDMLPGAVHPCGVGNVAWSMVLVFDRARLGDDGPEGWPGFFDLTRFPGGRGLRRGALGNLEIALMADEVAPEDVYALLRTPAGTDRAFAKLAALAPHITLWEAGRQPARLLDDLDAVMTTAWNGRIQRAITLDNRPFEIVWRGQVLDYGYWVIPKGHPRADLAHRFVAFATRPDRQAEQAKRIPYGPLRMAAVPPCRAEPCPMAAHSAGESRDVPQARRTLLERKPRSARPAFRLADVAVRLGLKSISGKPKRETSRIRLGEHAHASTNSHLPRSGSIGIPPRNSACRKFYRSANSVLLSPRAAIHSRISSWRIIPPDLGRSLTKAFMNST